MSKIEVRNLVKIFGSNPKEALSLLRTGATKDEVLEKTGHAVGVADVSFHVEEGEILVVMGLSGSGKSTLIRCLNRLIEPTSGTVSIDGVDVTGLGHKDLLEFRQRKLGMVFQNFALLPHRTVQTNVEFGLEIQGVDAGERARRAREALALVGLDGWEESYPSQLSGGMQQRVGIARALALDPDVMLMDEAFSALDPLIRRGMQDELIDLQKRLGKTIVFITHDLDEALKLGDRIVLMKDGAVVQEGTGEDILTNPATRYVARFVEAVDMSKVLTAGTVMKKARAVAYYTDGPRVAQRKMDEEDLSCLYVLDKQLRVRGVVTAEDVTEAARRGEKALDPLIRTDFNWVAYDAPVTDIMGVVAESGYPVAVLDEEQKLRGVVIRGVLLASLAERTDIMEVPEA